jgi:hypothetical protein
MTGIRNALWRINEALDAFENGDCVEDYTDPVAKEQVKGIVSKLHSSRQSLEELEKKLPPEPPQMPW